MENDVRDWCAWFKKYGVKKFAESLLANVQGAESICTLCGQQIYLDFFEGGGVGDWKTADGDYGCLESPETSEEGTGSHVPKRLA